MNGEDIDKVRRAGVRHANAAAEALAELRVAKNSIASLQRSAETRRAKVERLQTWDGMMETLDRHYPPEVVTGTSGDPGPRLVVAVREINRLREQHERDLIQVSEAHEARRKAEAKLDRLREASEAWIRDRVTRLDGPLTAGAWCADFRREAWH